MKRLDAAQLAALRAGGNCGNRYQTAAIVKTCGIAGALIGIAGGPWAVYAGAFAGAVACDWICYYGC